MTRLINIFGLITILSCITLQVYALNYAKEACSVTLYQDICLKTLSSYSNKARRSPSKWARLAVSVTIGEVKVVAQYVNNVNRHGQGFVGRHNRAALLDCVENVQDSLDNLHRSLDVLRSLSYPRFGEQMNDVLTWLSAALTDLDTCGDGFEGRRGKLIARLRYKVRDSSCVTSNALALANKLATTGLQDMGRVP